MVCGSSFGLSVETRDKLSTTGPRISVIDCVACACAAICSTCAAVSIMPLTVIWFSTLNKLFTDHVRSIGAGGFHLALRENARGVVAKHESMIKRESVRAQK